MSISELGFAFEELLYRIQTTDTAAIENLRRSIEDALKNPQVMIELLQFCFIKNAETESKITLLILSSACDTFKRELKADTVEFSSADVIMAFSQLLIQIYSTTKASIIKRQILSFFKDFRKISDSAEANSTKRATLLEVWLLICGNFETGLSQVVTLAESGRITSCLSRNFTHLGYCAVLRYRHQRF